MVKNDKLIWSNLFSGRSIIYRVQLNTFLMAMKLLALQIRVILVFERIRFYGSKSIYKAVFISGRHSHQLYTHSEIRTPARYNRPWAQFPDATVFFQFFSVVSHFPSRNFNTINIVNDYIIFFEIYLLSHSTKIIEDPLRHTTHENT